jgi:hypothetical protein
MTGIVLVGQPRYKGTTIKLWPHCRNHGAGTSPSHCQPGLNVESQRFDQGTVLSCSVSLRGSRLALIIAATVEKMGQE